MEPTSAKQFLIDKVVEEAKFEQLSLSEVERKMLYFTEQAPSLPDIYQVNEEFERNYDADDYETKIASLLKNARSRDQGKNPEQEQQWKNALDALSHQDHYILVMVNQAFGIRQSAGNRSRLRDFLIYIGIAVGLVVIALAASVWRARH